MRRWVIGFVLALLWIPLQADAKRKSILRFEGTEKPAAAQKAPAQEPPEEQAAPASAEGGAAPAGRRSDWYGEKYPAAAAQGEPGAGEASGLPGTPAEEETTTPAPRSSGRVRTKPVAPPLEAPIAAPSPGRATKPRTVAVPAAPTSALPGRPEPFTYAPTSPGAITSGGYDPSLAPPGNIRIPAPAPIVSGQPPPRPRSLPRLAPYGTAVPPDMTEPPASAPR